MYRPHLVVTSIASPHVSKVDHEAASGSWAGVELGRMSRARHEIYMVICAALTRLGVTYTLPAYAGMDAWLAMAARPAGEGLPFMPPPFKKGALHL